MQNVSDFEVSVAAVVGTKHAAACLLLLYINKMGTTLFHLQQESLNSEQYSLSYSSLQSAPLAGSPGTYKLLLHILLRLL